VKSTYNQTITKIVKKYLGNSSEKISDYAMAKQFLRVQVTATRLLKDIIFIVLGILSAGFGLKGFLLPNGFIPFPQSLLKGTLNLRI